MVRRSAVNKIPGNLSRLIIAPNLEYFRCKWKLCFFDLEQTEIADINYPLDGPQVGLCPVRTVILIEYREVVQGEYVLRFVI